PTAPPPVAGPVGIATQISDVFFRGGPILTLYVAGILSADLALRNNRPRRPVLTAFVGGSLVANPPPRDQPAVPAARRRADADDRPEGDLREPDQRPCRAPDLSRRVRLPFLLSALGLGA